MTAEREGNPFSGAKIGAYVVVGLVVGLMVFMYVRAVGPAAQDDRLGPCRALKPAASNSAMKSFPAHAIDFAAPDASGGEMSLSQYKGRVVFLNFWQTACPPCIEEMPSMEALQQKYGPKGLSVVALASEASFAPIEKFFGGRKPSMTVLLDPPEGDDAVGRISLRWGTRKWPETYLIDKRGVVRYYYISSRDWTSTNAQRCVQALLDE